MAPYRPRAFALRLGPPPVRLAPARTTILPLDYDTDVITLDTDTTDGDFDGSGRSLPGELLPEAFVSEGIPFKLGPTAAGARNALTCRGQVIGLPPLPAERLEPTVAARGRLEILAASRGGEAELELRVDGRPRRLTVHDFTGFVGQPDSIVVEGTIVPAAFMTEAFDRDATIAWVGTHRHDAREGNEPYVFTYLYRYGIDLPPAPPGKARKLELPRNDRIRILAATLVEDEGGAVAASEIVERAERVRIRPMGGLAIEPVTVTLSSERPDAAIRYTIDGAEPTAEDPLYTEPLTIAKDATVRARAFFGTRAADYVAVRSFRFSRPRPSQPSAAARPGVRYEILEGQWRSVEELAGLEPVRSGVADVISLDPRTRDLEVGVRFEGILEVPSDGVYTFFTRSDDGSTLAIDGSLVVDNDGLHGAVERSGQIALARGQHPITVLFFQRGGDIELGVWWEGPGFSREPIPASALSHVDRGR